MSSTFSISAIWVSTFHFVLNLHLGYLFRWILMCVAWEEALNEGRKVCWAQQQPWSAQWGESSVRCSFLHCARVTWGSVAVFLTFPSLCPPFAQLKEPWYWMWLVLSCLSLCGTKLILKKVFLLYSCIIWTPCPPVIPNDLDAQE